jgi:hypothetical protein
VMFRTTAQNNAASHVATNIEIAATTVGAPLAVASTGTEPVSPSPAMAEMVVRQRLPATRGPLPPTFRRQRVSLSRPRRSSLKMLRKVPLP